MGIRSFVSDRATIVRLELDFERTFTRLLGFRRSCRNNYALIVADRTREMGARIVQRANARCTEELSGRHHDDARLSTVHAPRATASRCSLRLRWRRT
jgi:hypothetical protein